jgi:hypothetical protein
LVPVKVSMLTIYFYLWIYSFQNLLSFNKTPYRPQRSIFYLPPTVMLACIILDGKQIHNHFLGGWGWDESINSKYLGINGSAKQ